MTAYHPPVGFHFSVEVMGFDNSSDSRFTDVSGLNVEMATEEIAEGGQNRFTQKYPVRTKYPELTLKRGLLKQSQMIDWIAQCIEDFDIEPRNISLKLLNEEHEPLMHWYLVGAYPVKWSISDFSATSNTYVVESLQFYYKFFSIKQD
ncbi:phage tail protein [Glaciecola sp. 1036]|uniref:phage tail protein n=1 Tax=Alteromonadaceae TaxID=72275 RepID=UPI003CFD028A